MFRLIPLLILIIDVIAIVDVIQSRKDIEKKILWVLVVLLLPGLGPVLYYFMGREPK